MIIPNQNLSIGFDFTANPVTELFGRPVSQKGTVSLVSQEIGNGIVLAAGSGISCPMPEAASDDLSFCFWLKPNDDLSLNFSDGVAQDVHIPLFGCLTMQSSSALPFSGWCFSRISRIDGLSDFIFTTYEDGQEFNYRFVGNNKYEWQFVVFQFHRSGTNSIFSLHVDGENLSLDSIGLPSSIVVSESNRLFSINTFVGTSLMDITAINSSNDIIVDLFLTTDPMADESFFYERVSVQGLKNSFYPSSSQFFSLPTRAAATGGVAGVAETSYGRYAVRKDGNYFSLNDARFNAVRNLKNNFLPEDIVPFKIAEGSAFTVDSTAGLTLKGCGIKML